MFIASICLILYYLWGNGYLWKAKKAPPPATYEEFTYPSIDESEIAKLTDFTTADPSAPTDPDAPIEPVQPIQVDCPVNFDELKNVNAEIIGWIYMSKPEISLPILRSHTDDTWYLYHDVVGKYKRRIALRRA